MAIWRRDLANGEFPSIIIGILIYNGIRSWQTKTIYATFEPYLPSDLLGLIPKTEYFTIDLFNTTDQALEDSIELGELRTAYLALKHGHEPDYLKTNAKFLFKFAMNLKPKNLLHLFLRWVSEYIQRRTKLSEPEFVHLLTDESEMSTQFKTVFELIEERTLARSADQIKKAEKEAKKAKADAQQAKIEKVQAEAKAKEAEAKAEAKAKEVIKNLMRLTICTDEQIVTQFGFSTILVASVRTELDAL